MDHLFQYKAVEPGGRIIESTVEAKSEDEAVKLLRTRDLNIIGIKQVEAKSKDISEIGIFTPKVKVPDVMIFCRQMSTMLDAGLPLDKSLSILVEQSTNKLLKTALADVSNQIKQGIQFSRAMRDHPKVFPELLINMVESGEMTGKLDEVLARMAIHYQKENRINSKVKGAMIYPMVLAILTVGIVIGMLTLIMPTFMTMFESSGVELPLPTKIMVALSDSLKGFWYIYILTIGGIIVFINRFNKTEGGKRFFAMLCLQIPVVKGAVKQIATSRFTRTLATLLASGVPIVRALEASAETTNNILVIEDMKAVMEGIKKGSSLAVLLRKIPFFPPMMISMVSVGEETGDLDGLLEKTADFYDEELESAMSRLVSLLEPIMIIIMAVIIGSIVVAMMLPMFGMFETLQ